MPLNPYVTWRIHVWHDTPLNLYVTWHNVFMCDMTCLLIHMWHDVLMCDVTCLSIYMWCNVLMCDMKCHLIHMWHDVSMCKMPLSQIETLQRQLQEVTQNKDKVIDRQKVNLSKCIYTYKSVYVYIFAPTTKSNTHQRSSDRQTKGKYVRIYVYI